MAQGQRAGIQRKSKDLGSDSTLFCVFCSAVLSFVLALEHFNDALPSVDSVDCSPLCVMVMHIEA
jgi:hypothetical protein